MTKTEFMLIGSRQRLSTLTDSSTITINDNQVSPVTTAKSLGVPIDNKLAIGGRRPHLLTQDDTRNILLTVASDHVLLKPLFTTTESSRLHA